MNRGRLCAASTAGNPARRRAIALVSNIVAGGAMAPALDKVDSELSEAVLVDAREVLEHLCSLARS
jgi:hypothetical protein